MSLKMPAEWEPHSATVMIFPERPGSWPYGAKYARPVFASAIREICAGEKVYLSVSPECQNAARALLFDCIDSGRVQLVLYRTDDCWARDMAPTFVKDGNRVMGVDWAFNAWGGDFDGLYKSWQKDDGFARYFCHTTGLTHIDAHPFVLEGGSIHSNGAGTVLTTEECLLGKGRNPNLTRGQIEGNLKKYLGAERVIWLPRGICGDETNGHVDNICAFANKNTVFLAWSDSGEQGAICRQNRQILQNSGFNVIELPLPRNKVTVSREDMAGYVFEEDEQPRTEGEVLAASYVNFYICNACVLVPQFGDVNDGLALKIIGSAFPQKKIAPVNARPLIVGGGNIHCLTQQIPL